jgi:hypothetical protein
MISSTVDQAAVRRAQDRLPRFLLRLLGRGFIVLLLPLLLLFRQMLLLVFLFVFLAALVSHGSSVQPL